MSALHTGITTTGSVKKEGDVPKNLRAFRATVWKCWEKNGRHDLSWRKTKDPYKILVSEIMLQQTQVPRVVEKYKEFLKAFPNVNVLSRSNLADVLKVWSGMGYNRRAKSLREAAKEIVERYGGKVPRDFAALRALPGVGPYTASAVRVFAFNEPDALIETNVRAAFIHHFFLKYKGPSFIFDKDILPIVEAAAKGQDSRTWHWALMDYGVHIKKLHKNPARRSAHYAKQSKFEGSLRQVRGEILRILQAGPQTKSNLKKGFRKPLLGEQLEKALEGLARDGLIEKRKGKPARPGWRIA